MRLRAKVSNISLFIKVVQTVDKINKECVMHLSDDKLLFILTNDITDGVAVWSGCKPSTIFDEYKIDSMNANEISFKVHLDNLLKALKSGSHPGASDISMKLTKKSNQPVLNFVITLHGAHHGVHGATMVQDVPVELLSAQQLLSYVEPRLPDPEVHIMMPPLKSLRTVVDKMKNLSDELTIYANMAGELTLKIQQPLVDIATNYKNLEHPHIEGRSPPRRSPEHSAEVKVDIKKFARFLYSYQVMPTNVICCIIENRALVLHVLLDDLYLTYYIPVLLGSM